MNTRIKRYVNDQLGKRPNSVILEIGAHYGEDTKDMFNVFSTPEIYCFDPDPRNSAFFRKHFKMDGKNIDYRSGKIYFYEVALSNKNSEMDFYMSYAEYPEGSDLPEKYKWVGDDYRDLKLNGSGASSLKLGDKAVNNAESVKVKAITLDSWAVESGVDIIDFIWMDVQGAESDVISGGGNVFQNTKFVWTEYGETQYEGGMSRKQTQRKFESMGFTYEKRQENNLLFRNKKFDEMHG